MWPKVDTRCECCPASKFLLLFQLTKSSDQCQLDQFKFADTTCIILPWHWVGAKLWPIIDTRCECCPALVCLLTFGLMQSSDKCDFDHFKFPVLFKHCLINIWGKIVANNWNQMWRLPCIVMFVNIWGDKKFRSMSFWSSYISDTIILPQHLGQTWGQ